MKLSKYAIIGAVAVLFAFAVQIYAIEGLQVSVQCSNVVLSWPSTEGETYTVQYRQTLSSTDSWTTLADYFPATSGTNVTCYVHSNIVQNPVCDGSSGSFAAATLGLNSSALAQPDAGPIALAPMAIRADGSGGAVPLALYPPGMDMSGFIIFAPLTGESVNGSADTTRLFSLNTPQFDGPQPLDGGGGSGNSMPEPDTGFYRVVRDGAHLVGITNGMTLSGIVSVPVEFANPSGNVTAISITEDDSPVGDAIQTAPNISPVAVALDTTLMSNGVHQISASVRWDVYGGTNDENSGGFAEADSPPVTVNVYNEISFPNWVPRFGELANSLFISVQSAHTDADWYIDVYDSEYSYIGTFAGHTYDGNIEGSWNLQGPYGEFHTSDNFFIFVVTTYFNSSSPDTGAAPNGATPMAGSGSASAVTPRIYKVFDPWPGPGAWVVVAQHAWDSAHDSDLLYGELGGFIGGAQSVGWTVMPPPQGYNDYGSLLAYGLTFGAANPQGDTDWANFRQALYDARSRNLVYFGHGGPDGLGYNPANVHRYISAAEIGNMLHSIPNNQTNRHAFRFVFLDGCATAKGNLPAAFGFQHQEIFDLDFYTGAGLRPSAFAGWTATKWISFLDNQGYINTDHFNFIQHIQTQMLLGWGLQESIDYAAHTPDVSWAFVWLNQMQVYGFFDLHFGQYNN